MYFICNVISATRSFGARFLFSSKSPPNLQLLARRGLAGFLGLTVVNVYKYIFCMYAFPNDLEKIDVIFIYCSGFFVSILYF